tara:strand:+ start:448 stop:966 length:519 start_codon:yes stop_codon:yes gene_type:complete
MSQIGGGIPGKTSKNKKKKKKEGPGFLKKIGNQFNKAKLAIVKSSENQFKHMTSGKGGSHMNVVGSKSKKKGLSKTQKLQKKSDIKARKQAIKSDSAGKNIGARSRFVGRAEARSYLPDDLRAKPKSRWTARDKKRARKAELQGMHKTTKRVNDRKSGNIAKNIKSRLPRGY